jgi:phosphate starvation-inducible membrane PsiE
MAEDETRPTVPYTPSRRFQQVEHAIYVALGVLLAIVAIIALVHAAADVALSAFGTGGANQIFSVMDQLLFVLMLVEILHTVGVSIKSGALNAEPFLVVGLIASIRRVLVITLQSSNMNRNAQSAADETTLFHHAMTELGVLAALILVMVVSIVLLRRVRYKEE